MCFKASIVNDKDRVVATGHSAGMTKGDKATEKLETVAVGRALALMGIGLEEGLASLDEMVDFLNGGGTTHNSTKKASNGNTGAKKVVVDGGRAAVDCLTNKQLGFITSYGGVPETMTYQEGVDFIQENHPNNKK